MILRLSDNNFGAQVDDFGGPTRNPAQVDDFADYSDDNFGEEDFSDFATTNSPSDVNQFGVDDFGDPRLHNLMHLEIQYDHQKK